MSSTICPGATAGGVAVKLSTTGAAANSPAGDRSTRRADRRARDHQTRERVGLRRHGWVLLERALGREGIQALEIDAAGPEVSQTCNELLQACYGPRFRVELRTIRAQNVQAPAAVAAQQERDPRPVRGYRGRLEQGGLAPLPDLLDLSVVPAPQSIAATTRGKEEQ